MVFIRLEGQTGSGMRNTNGDFSANFGCGGAAGGQGGPVGDVDVGARWFELHTRGMVQDVVDQWGTTVMV